MISGFCSEGDENCTLLDYYAGSSGNFLLTFWVSVLVPSLGFKNPKVLSDSWIMKMGLIGCPETSVRNYHCSLDSNPEERSSKSHYKFDALWVTVHIFLH